LDGLPRGTVGSAFLADFAAGRFGASAFTVAELDAFLGGFEPQGDLSENDALFQFCAFAVKFHSSRAAIRILRSALASGSAAAFRLLTDGELPTTPVFAELVAGLRSNEANELYISALRSLLQSIAPTAMDPESEDAEAGVLISACDSSSDSTALEADAADTGAGVDNPAPTPQIVLFCRILPHCSTHGELLSLLAPSASAICVEFGQSLMAHLQRGRRRCSRAECLSAFSAAMPLLAEDTALTMAQVFLASIPGPAMLFFAVSLQRVATELCPGMLRRCLPFAHSHSKCVARTVALVSHSRPDTSLALLSDFLALASTRRRVLWVFRSSEIDIESVIIGLRMIGCTALFVHSDYFADHFLPLATGFLNKDISSILSTPPGTIAALSAIRKLAIRVARWQKDHDDFVFPFKDFLAQAICDGKLADCMAAVTCLSELVPIRPVRFYDKFSFPATTLLSLTELGDVGSAIIHFWDIVLESIPQLEVLVSFLKPLVPSLLLNDNWRLILSAVHHLCQTRDRLEIVADFRGTIEEFIVMLAPLTHSDEKRMGEEVFSAVLWIRAVMLGDESFLSAANSKIGPSEALRIAVGVLALFRDNRIRLHRREAAVIAGQLLSQPGVDRFDMDGAIVNLALDAAASETDSKMDDQDGVVGALLDCIGVLARVRLSKILRAVASGKFDRHLPALVDRLSEGQESFFLMAVAELLGDSQSHRFAREIILLSESAIARADDETFVRLFLAVLPTEPPPFALFEPFFGSPSLSEACGFIADHRPDSFPLFLSHFPESPTESLVRFSLTCAVACVDLCPQFLAYASGHLNDAHAGELLAVMTNIPRERLGDLNQNIISFLFENPDSSAVSDCLVAVAVKFVDFDPFWSELVDRAVLNLGFFSRILSRVLDCCPIDPRFLMRLAPGILLGGADPGIAELRERLWGSPASKASEAAEAILADVAGQDGETLRAAVVAGIRGQKDRADESSGLLCGLCRTLDEGTSEAVGLIIDLFPFVSDRAGVTAALLRLIASED
jgi:hypothetical protein